MKDMREVIKGEVYWADIPYMEGSNIQSGIRPVIIWCNKMAGKYSPVVQYIPVTSKTEKMRRKRLPVQVLLERKCPYAESVALVEQFGCIDKSRLMNKICTLSKKDMYDIMMASMIQQDINVDEIVKDMKQFAYA